MPDIIRGMSEQDSYILKGLTPVQAKGYGKLEVFDYAQLRSEFKKCVRDIDDQFKDEVPNKALEFAFLMLYCIGPSLVRSRMAFGIVVGRC